MRTQRGDGHLHAQGRGLRRNQPCPHPDLRFQPPAPGEISVSCLSAPGRGGLLWEPYQTHTATESCKARRIQYHDEAEVGGGVRHFTCTMIRKLHGTQALSPPFLVQEWGFHQEPPTSSSISLQTPPEDEPTVYLVAEDELYVVDGGARADGSGPLIRLPLV